MERASTSRTDARAGQELSLRAWMLRLVLDSTDADAGHRSKAETGAGRTIINSDNLENGRERDRYRASTR